MRYIWETCDIKAGRKIDSYNRAERYLIGYDPSRNHEEGNLNLVSLRDGMMTTKNLTAEGMAAYLNDPQIRAFRPVDVVEDDIQPKQASASD